MNPIAPTTRIRYYHRHQIKDFPNLAQLLNDGYSDISRPTDWRLPIPDPFFDKDNTQGIWTSPVNAIQRKASYNDLWDAGFKFGEAIP